MMLNKLYHRGLAFCALLVGLTCGTQTFAQGLREMPNYPFAPLYGDLRWNWSEGVYQATYSAASFGSLNGEGYMLSADVAVPQYGSSEAGLFAGYDGRSAVYYGSLNSQNGYTLVTLYEYGRVVASQPVPYTSGHLDLVIGRGNVVELYFDSRLITRWYGRGIGRGDWGVQGYSNTGAPVNFRVFFPSYR